MRYSLYFNLSLSLLAAVFLFIRIGLAQPKTKIGISLPLSGGSASEGLDLQRMLLFANDKFAGSAYEMVFEDDLCSDKQAVAIAHRFAAQEKIKYVLGFACSGAVLASAQIYEKAKVPVIALATGAPEISKAGDYIFRTIPSLDIAARKLWEHAAQRYKKVGILSEETAYCQGLARSFIEYNIDSAMQIDSESFLPETSDFRTQLLKFRQKGVEALFLNPQSETGMIRLYGQLLDLNWKVPVYAAYYPGFSEFLEKFGGRGDGIVFADLPFVSDSLDGSGKQLYEIYKSRHGSPQSSEFYFVTTLAAFYALHEAIQSETDVREYLYSHPFQGFFGSFRFDSNGDVQGDRLTFILKTLRGGKPAALD
ncbi:MAG: hypothetical protein DCC75_09950 [Proteobacteria bacterium]|nr:MAG: hypothetical protein DCC75_09950 [Pseudomonadota bacterium]